MKKTFRILILMLAVAPLLASRASAGGFRKPAGELMKDQYIVILEDGIAARPGKGQGQGRGASDVATELTRMYGGRVIKVWEHAIQGFLVEMPEGLARHLAKDPWVKLVEQDAGVVDAEAAITPQCGFSATLLTSTLPTSPQTIQCPNPGIDCVDDWALSRIDQRFKPHDYSYSFGKKGQGVHMYFLDSGIHPQSQEFTNGSGVTRISNGVNYASHNGNDLWAMNHTPSLSNTFDDDGHGTHIAAVAAGLRFGVAKAATIHPVRVAFESSSRISIMIDGINWIAANHVKPAVVNVSLNFWVMCPKYSFDDPSDYTTMDTAIRNLVTVYGIPVVNSAGNFNKDVADFSPSRVPELIVVGGTTETDERWALAAPGFNCRPFSNTQNPCDPPAYSQCGSNWGSTVDLWAPASTILSAWNMGISGTYACQQTGTSMSAPLVAGTAALYLQSFPTATPTQVRDAIVNRATVNVLTGSLGFGSPNRLLYIDQPATANFTASCPTRTCTFTSTATDDIGIASQTWTFGDTTSGSGTPASHAYAAAGTYTVTLTVTDTWGNVSTKSQSVSVP